MVLNQGPLFSQETQFVLAICWDKFIVASRTQYVAKYPTLHGTAPMPKNYPVQNINSVEAGKPCSRLFHEHKAYFSNLKHLIV